MKWFSTKSHRFFATSWRFFWPASFCDSLEREKRYFSWSKVIRGHFVNLIMIISAQMKEKKYDKVGTGSAVLLSKLWNATVWMDMKNRDRSELLQTPEVQPLGTCTYVLLLSYFTRVLEQPEKRGQQCRSHCKMWSARSRVWFPRGWLAFQVFNPVIMIV